MALPCSRRLYPILVLPVLAGMLSPCVQASSYFVSGSGPGSGGETIMFEAAFDRTATTATLELRNPNPDQVSFLANLISGLFWNVTIENVTFTPVSAVANVVIDENNVVQGTNVDVSGFWAFRVGSFGGAEMRVGGTGFDFFGPSNLFLPCDSCGQPDGADYLIAGVAGVEPGSDGIPNQPPYVMESILFTWNLGGSAADDYDPARDVLLKFATAGTQPELLISPLPLMCRYPSR